MLHLNNRLGTFHTGAKTARQTPRLFRPLDPQRQTSDAADLALRNLKDCGIYLKEDGSVCKTNSSGRADCGSTAVKSGSGLNGSPVGTPVVPKPDLSTSGQQFKVGDVVECLPFDKWAEGALPAYPKQSGNIGRITNTTGCLGEKAAFIDGCVGLWPLRALKPANICVKQHGGVPELKVGQMVFITENDECFRAGNFSITNPAGLTLPILGFCGKRAAYFKTAQGTDFAWPIESIWPVSEVTRAIETEPQKTDGWVRNGQYNNVWDLDGTKFQVRKDSETQWVGWSVSRAGSSQGLSVRGLKVDDSSSDVFKNWPELKLAIRNCMGNISEYALPWVGDHK